MCFLAPEPWEPHPFHHSTETLRPIKGQLEFLSGLLFEGVRASQLDLFRPGLVGTHRGQASNSRWTCLDLAE